MLDYYTILGIQSTANQNDIRSAFRKLSIKFHPDKNNGDEFFENMFKQIQEANSVLSNPILRAEYDKKFNKSSNKNLSNPIIEYFKCDKEFFYSGNEITFEWKCYNSDIVELRPFGVFEKSGIKTFKLNNVNKQYFFVELIATNTHTATNARSVIRLENSLFSDIKQTGIKNQKTKNNTIKWYEEIWFISIITFFIWPIGIFFVWNSRLVKESWKLFWTFFFIFITVLRFALIQ